jgi:acyl-CoA synthetase (AMP-forming)/AMP-acid ligase II
MERATYGDLDAEATEFAALLEELGVSSLMLCLQSCRAFVVALLGAMRASVTVTPVPSLRSVGSSDTLERTLSICAESRPDLILLDSGKLESDRERRLLGEFDVWPGMPGYSLLLSRRAPFDRSGRRSAPFEVIQYSSGSTRAPRAIPLSEGNLAANAAAIAKAFQMTTTDIGVSWLPVHHDMGLMGMVLQPLYMGIQCIHLAPTTFLRRPSLWLETISRFRATISGGPDFGYRHCVAHLSHSTLQPLDLSSWRVAFSGAEPIRAETLRQFASATSESRFSAAAFTACYGLAEATLLVSCSRTGEGIEIFRARPEPLLPGGKIEEATEREPCHEYVSCGEPYIGEVRVAEEGTERELGDLEVGEILVRGDHVSMPVVAASNRNDERCSLIDCDSSSWLRTGDLGFTRDGGLYVTGRLSETLCVRGKKLSPTFVEQQATRSSNGIIRCVAVMVRLPGGTVEELVLVIEAQSLQGTEVAHHDIAKAVSNAVTKETGLRIDQFFFVPRQTIRFTSSGKPRRLDVAWRLQRGELTYVAVGGMHE